MRDTVRALVAIDFLERSFGALGDYDLHGLAGLCPKPRTKLFEMSGGHLRVAPLRDVIEPTRNAGFDLPLEQLFGQLDRKRHGHWPVLLGDDDRLMLHGIDVEPELLARG